MATATAELIGQVLAPDANSSATAVMFAPANPGDLILLAIADDGSGSTPFSAFDDVGTSYQEVTFGAVNPGNAMTKILGGVLSNPMAVGHTVTVEWDTFGSIWDKFIAVVRVTGVDTSSGVTLWSSAESIGSAFETFAAGQAPLPGGPAFLLGMAAGSGSPSAAFLDSACTPPPESWTELYGGDTGQYVDPTVWWAGDSSGTFGFLSGAFDSYDDWSATLVVFQATGAASPYVDAAATVNLAVALTAAPDPAVPTVNAGATITLSTGLAAAAELEVRAAAALELVTGLGYTSGSDPGRPAELEMTAAASLELVTGLEAAGALELTAAAALELGVGLAAAGELYDPGAGPPAPEHSPTVLELQAVATALEIRDERTALEAAGPASSLTVQPVITEVTIDA